MTELEIALEAAHAAGALLRDAYDRGPTRVDHKGAVDLVTEVDEACEAAVRRVLSRHTPDIEVLGEEQGGAWEAATRWVIDPIDGTTNFVHGFPWFAVSIALEVDGEPRAGVVYAPVDDRCFAAAAGQGATLNDSPIRVSQVSALSQALVATGFPYDRRQRLDALLARVRTLLDRAQGVRRAGAASLDLALVAAGQLDAYWEVGLKPWDIAAGQLLITEAGGRVTNHDGSQPLDGRTPEPLATNGLIHEEMIAALAGPLPR